MDIFGDATATDSSSGGGGIRMLLRVLLQHNVLHLCGLLCLITGFGFAYQAAHHHRQRCRASRYRKWLTRVATNFHNSVASEHSLNHCLPHHHRHDQRQGQQQEQQQQQQQGLTGVCSSLSCNCTEVLPRHPRSKARGKPAPSPSASAAAVSRMPRSTPTTKLIISCNQNTKRTTPATAAAPAPAPKALAKNHALITPSDVPRPPSLAAPSPVQCNAASARPPHEKPATEPVTQASSPDPAPMAARTAARTAPLAAPTVKAPRPHLTTTNLSTSGDSFRGSVRRDGMPTGGTGSNTAASHQCASPSADLAPATPARTESRTASSARCAAALPPPPLAAAAAAASHHSSTCAAQLQAQHPAVCRSLGAASQLRNKGAVAGPIAESRASSNLVKAQTEQPPARVLRVAAKHNSAFLSSAVRSAQCSAFAGNRTGHQKRHPSSPSNMHGVPTVGTASPWRCHVAGKPMAATATEPAGNAPASGAGTSWVPPSALSASGSIWRPLATGSTSITTPRAAAVSASTAHSPVELPPPVFAIPPFSTPPASSNLWRAGPVKHADDALVVTCNDAAHNTAACTSDSTRPVFHPCLYGLDHQLWDEAGGEAVEAAGAGNANTMNCGRAGSAVIGIAGSSSWGSLQNSDSLTSSGCHSGDQRLLDQSINLSLGVPLGTVGLMAAVASKGSWPITLDDRCAASAVQVPPPRADAFLKSSEHGLLPGSAGGGAGLVGPTSLAGQFSARGHSFSFGERCQDWVPVPGRLPPSARSGVHEHWAAAGDYTVPDAVPMTEAFEGAAEAASRLERPIAAIGVPTAATALPSTGRLDCWPADPSHTGQALQAISRVDWTVSGAPLGMRPFGRPLVATTHHSPSAATDVRSLPTPWDVYGGSSHTSTWMPASAN